jgi:hypothetical protein
VSTAQLARDLHCSMNAGMDHGEKRCGSLGQEVGSVPDQQEVRSVPDQQEVGSVPDQQEVHGVITRSNNDRVHAVPPLVAVGSACIPHWTQVLVQEHV